MGHAEGGGDGRDRHSLGPQAVGECAAEGSARLGEAAENPGCQLQRAGALLTGEEVVPGAALGPTGAQLGDATGQKALVAGVLLRRGGKVVEGGELPVPPILRSGRHRLGHLASSSSGCAACAMGIAYPATGGCTNGRGLET